MGFAFRLLRTDIILVYFASCSQTGMHQLSSAYKERSYPCMYYGIFIFVLQRSTFSLGDTLANGILYRNRMDPVN